MKLFLLIPALLIVGAVFGVIPDEAKFGGEAENIRQHFNSLFEASKLVNAPKAKKEARAKIEGALDWERVGQDCLGKKNWGKASPKNRSEFASTLKDVVIRTAFSRLDKIWADATSRFEKIDVTGNEAHILCRFYFPTNSFTLDYYLNKKNNRWLIYDLAYEDIRYSSNINDQIEAFLKEKSMGDLLEKLRKRRDELPKG